MRRRLLLASGPAAGGLRTHLEALVRGLPALGWEVAVAAPPSLALRVEAKRFPFEVGDRAAPLAVVRAGGQLRRAIAAWGPDILHVHGVKAALVAVLVAGGGRPPLVVTFHNLWRGGPLTPLVRWAAARAAERIAVSQAVRTRLGEWGVAADSVRVIPNGLDPAAYPPAPPHDGPFTLAMLARLTEEKGIGILLAWARQYRGDPPLRLILAGDGPLRAAVEAAAARLPWFEARGPVADVLAIYHAADAVVMPSLAEGMPMVALEAQACGLPLIASRVGGLPEIVRDGETGLLMPPGDVAALAAAIDRLARDRALARRMGAAGRARICAEFTEDRMLARLDAAYREALAAAR